MIKPLDKSFELDVVNLKKAALVYRAINHKLRQQMLRTIHQNGRITVTPLYKKMHLVQSEASMHLAILRKAGFVYTERQGKHIFYSVNYQRVTEVHKLTKSIVERASAKL